jgi:hypothetical protein
MVQRATVATLYHSHYPAMELEQNQNVAHKQMKAATMALNMLLNI